MTTAFKQTEIGTIPEDWHLTTLGTLLAFTNGLNADKTAYGKGMPFINVMEPITRSHIYGPEIPGRVQITSEAALAYLVKHGDIVFNRTSETDSELGLAAVYLGDERIVFGGFVIRGRPISDALDPKYSGYALRAKTIRSQIISMGQGAIRANIGQQNLQRVLVAVPPKSEQCAIAQALGDVDALIAALDRLIAKKRDIKQATMQLLLTGKTRLPGFSGKWVVKTFADIVTKIVGGGTPSRANPAFWGNEIPWVTVKDFTTHSPTETQEYITKLGLNSSASHLIPAGTLITATRIALGKAVVYDVDVAINQDLKALFFKSDINVPFLLYWFENFGKLIEELGSGSTVKGVSLPELKRFTVNVPEHSEQVAIAAVLSDMDAELSALEARRDKTRALKQGMMQELLTGKTRLI